MENPEMPAKEERTKQQKEAENTVPEKIPLEKLTEAQMKRLGAFVSKEEAVIDARAEKAGVIDMIRSVGESYNKLPLKKKLLISAGLIITASSMAAVGGAVGGAVATAAFTGSAIQRIFGGAATFVTVEGLLKASAEKEGQERSDAEKRRHTAEALIAGILVGGGVLSHAIGNIYHQFTPETIAPAATTSETAAPAAVQAEISSQTIPKIEFVVEKGGTLWGDIEAKLNSQGLFEGMEAGQKIYVIDAIKDKFAAMSPEELKDIGFSSGNIDVIHPGDRINLTGVLGDKELLPSVVHQAEMLSPEQIGSIETPKAVGVPAEALVPSAEPAPEQFMSQEILPNDPQVLAYAEQTVTADIDKMFGSKGIFGLFAQNGVDSIDWKDPDVGFANQTVDKVLVMQTSDFPATDSMRQFGMENYFTTVKMQEYLSNVAKQTGTYADTGEKVADYLRRAATIKISKSYE